MTLELRVLNGTRAGEREQFQKTIVTIGRHPMSDLRFDPEKELDVSTRHAEIRGLDGIWVVVDEGSTNGTFVNGERVNGESPIGEGDVLSFGAHGPRVEVHGIGARAAPATAMRPSVPRMDTSVRVAAAVKEQTQGLKRAVMVGGALVLVVGVAAFMFVQRSSSAREAELMSAFARSESTLVSLQAKLASARPADTLYVAALKAELADRQRDIAEARKQIASGAAASTTVSELSRKVDRSVVMQQSIAQMDLTRVVDLNDAAVAMVASDLDGKVLAGTAFGVGKSGLLLTNKHVVRTEAGNPAQRIAVIFANTRAWLPAKIVRLSDSDDLALIQVDVSGTYPVVAGVSRTGSLARVGAPVAAIGYPGATDTPMEGTGLKITARTTSTAGTVSKRLDDVLQVDSYAGHGSSGSPVFDSQGHVVGVIWGGDRESQGRIVYAVPAQRIAAFLGADGASILR